MSELRNLPSVDKLLNDAAGLITAFGRPLTTEAIRDELDRVRRSHKPGSPVPADMEILEKVNHTLTSWTAPTLQPVINATGVIIHTNLGRAPLSRAAREAMQQIGAGYSNLEFDLAKGRRGSRYTHAEELICRLTGAGAALVVNNNASAVMLALAALANRRRVVISRTQLVEIGGGFRIPDVMKQSGAKLVEIGTTNRVHLRDYVQALDEQPIAAVLSAHQSNFKIVGFTTEPSHAEIARAAHEHGVPYIEDLGSGTFLDTTPFGLEREPTVQASLEAGVDLVTFSGDKLLGGPQAGLIAGRADLVARLKKHPLARAVRADKTTYAGLSATLLHYLKDEAFETVPVWQMISAAPDSLQQRAQAWLDALPPSLSSTASIKPGESTVGGGSLPGQVLPTHNLVLDVPSPQKLIDYLRTISPPLIARAQDDTVLLDPRTVLPDQDPLVRLALQSLSQLPDT